MNEDTLIHLNNPHSDIEQLWFRVSVAENADLGGWAERKWICGIVFLAEKRGPSLIPMWTLLLNLMEDRVFLDFWNSKGIPAFSFYITWKMSFPHELQKSTTRKITLTSNLLLKAWFHKYTWSLTKHVSVVKAYRSGYSITNIQLFSHVGRSLHNFILQFFLLFRGLPWLILFFVTFL